MNPKPSPSSTSLEPSTPPLTAVSRAKVEERRRLAEYIKNYLAHGGVIASYDAVELQNDAEHIHWPLHGFAVNYNGMTCAGAARAYMPREIDLDAYRLAVEDTWQEDWDS